MSSNDWLKQASCRGMDTNLFFPEHGQHMNHIKLIESVCGGCPVKQECLEEGFKNYIQIGFFGGLSARQRDKLISLGLRRVS